MMKWKKSPPTVVIRSISRRTVRLLIGLILPIAFLRSALLVLDSVAPRCLPWRVFGGSDTAAIREELTRTLLETINVNDVDTIKSSHLVPENFRDLVHDIALNGQDIKYLAFRTKALISGMENRVKKAKWQEYLNWYLASRGVPNGLHCLTLKLAEEYATNAEARKDLFPPHYIYRLTNHSFHHVVLLTDNVLAASVVISTAVNASKHPEKLVFHVVTDKKTYASMHAWFALNAIPSAVVEVKGLHQYDWPQEMNMLIKEMLEIQHHLWKHKYQALRITEDLFLEENDHRLDLLSLSATSLLNHLRLYLPELFPGLNKVVLLDDDIIVQHDLWSLWELDLQDNVLGAVFDSSGGNFGDYFNFSDPIISAKLDPNSRRWLLGVNIIDLEKWRKTSITPSYHQWLKQNLDAGFELWRSPGVLPLALLAFENYVYQLDPSWQESGLGYKNPRLEKHKLEDAAILHFNGPAKPWFEVAPTEVRSLWYKHVNFSNNHITRCGVSMTL